MSSRRQLPNFFIVLLVLASTASAQPQPDIPHLQKHGSVIQLYVHGQPFLMLAGELHNSSSSSLDYMRSIWPKLAGLNLNTVLVPVSWELIEPQEGKFDFRLVDGLINDAHANKLRLVFLWFGSWKNTYSSYVPEWIKRDEKRFPRVLLADGRPTERLSPFSDSNRKADAIAFGELMKHIREVDSAQTVLMIQVENEVGVIPEARDYSPAANAAFAGAVPKPLLEYLKDHADTLSDGLRNAWFGAGKKTTGTWEEVFGKSPLTSDLFMAWQYAVYIDAVAAAGKVAYPLPMYANAALIRPNYQPGQYNSGGPLPHSIDIYRGGAPHLDFLSPDIYFDDFAEWVTRYRRDGNAVFVPEAKGGFLGAANALYVIGQLDGIGFSPFAIDGDMEMPPQEKPDSVERPIRNTYAALAHLSGLILEK
ncbi:MAG TPA: beta-galactosidase, partial [Terriglobales bacterium]|nr:beta-galactosidase [Terriglobales bacterium]